MIKTVLLFWSTKPAKPLSLLCISGALGQTTHVPQRSVEECVELGERGPIKLQVVFVCLTKQPKAKRTDFITSLVGSTKRTHTLTPYQLNKH